MTLSEDRAPVVATAPDEDFELPGDVSYCSDNDEARLEATVSSSEASFNGFDEDIDGRGSDVECELAKGSDDFHDHGAEEAVPPPAIAQPLTHAQDIGEFYSPPRVLPRSSHSSRGAGGWSQT